jgi:hypothetical protein
MDMNDQFKRPKMPKLPRISFEVLLPIIFFTVIGLAAWFVIAHCNEKDREREAQRQVQRDRYEALSPAEKVEYTEFKYWKRQAGWNFNDMTISEWRILKVKGGLPDVGGK